MSTPSKPRPPAGNPTRQLLDELDALMERMLELPVNQLGEDLRKPAPETPRVVSAEEEEEFRPPADDPAPPVVGLRQEPARAPLPSPAPAAPPREVPPAPTLRLTPTTPPAEEPPGMSAASWERVLPIRPWVDEPGERSEEPAEPGFVMPGPLPWGEEPRAAGPVDLERIIPASPEVLEAISPRPEPPPAAPNPWPRVGAWAGTASPPAADPGPGWLRPVLAVNRAFDAGTAWLGAPGRWLRGPRGRALVGWTGLGLLAGAVVWVVLAEFGWTW